MLAVLVLTFGGFWSGFGGRGGFWGLGGVIAIYFDKY